VARAARLWGAAETLAQTNGTPLHGDIEVPLYAHIITSCRDASPILFAAAAEDGRRMSVEDACGYALEAG